MKICAYIAGDKNIIYPSIVCLSSVKKYNKDIDLFLFTEKRYATDEHIRLCNKYNITIIDINEIDKKHTINYFSAFMRWPVHVFYNYIAPDFLYTKGYNYAIKLDYDMLCIDAFNIDEILPSKNEGICVIQKRNLSTYIDEDNLNKIESKFKLDDFKSTNTGFIVFNLEFYNKKNVSKLYGDVFMYFTEKEIISEETSEQFCFGLLQSTLGVKFKKLKYLYNFRPYIETQNINNTKIIHYTTVLKPWKQFITEDIAKFNKDGYIRHVLLTSYWIEHANSLHFTEKWYANENFSIHDIYNIFNQSLKYFDKNERKLILERYILYIQKNCNYNTIHYDKKYRYVQIRMFGTNNIHYEILFRSGYIAICIHFEKEWEDYAEYLKNVVSKSIKMDMIHNSKKAEIYYLVKDINNINEVCNITKAIIEQSYESISFFINMHNYLHEIDISNYKRERERERERERIIKYNF